MVSVKEYGSNSQQLVNFTPQLFENYFSVLLQIIEFPSVVCMCNVHLIRTVRVSLLHALKV